MTKTSHKKNRPFDFKLIDLVEPNPVLYQRQNGLTTYETMKAKNVLWDRIATEMGQPIQFCIMRWNNLRGQFQKELRRCRELCPKSGVIRGSTWPYLERLRFLESTVQYNKPKRERISKRQTRQQAEEEMEEDQEQIKTMTENDDTNLEWEDCDEFFASDSDIENKNHIEIFKHDDSENLNQQQQPHNVVIDGSEFSILTEIIVNSDNVQMCNDVPIQQQEQQIDEEISLIEEPQSLTHDQIQSDGNSDEQLQTQHQHSVTSNLQRMRWLMDGFDEMNRLRCERRLMAYVCKVQLCALYNQDTDSINI